MLNVVIAVRPGRVKSEFWNIKIRSRRLLMPFACSAIFNNQKFKILIECSSLTVNSTANSLKLIRSSKSKISLLNSNGNEQIANATADNKSTFSSSAYHGRRAILKI